MPFDSPAERPTPQEQPRVRPSLWAIMLMVGGIGLLLLGLKQEWFLGALATGKLHNLTYFLAWALVGLVYGVIAALICRRQVRPPVSFKVRLAFLAFSAFMVVGSQVDARKTMSRLFLVVDGITLYPVANELVVLAM